MADEAKQEALPKGRVVYLGTVEISGGKAGELWATEALVINATTVEFLRKQGSAFAKGKGRSREVGEVYEVGVNIENGRLIQMQGDKKWQANIRNDVIAAMLLTEKGKAAARAQTLAQERARKKGPLNDLLDEMARIVAKAPAGQQDTLLQGIVAELRSRSHAIWRKGR
jgi:hypothetical protein